MRRFLIVSVIMVIGLMLYACGPRKAGGSPGEAPKGTDDQGSVSMGGVSGDSIALEQLQMSDTEAFSRAEDIVQSMTREEKIAQMFLVNMSALDLSQTEGKKAGKGRITEVSEEAKNWLATYPVGGIILTEDNVDSADQAKQMIQDLQDSVSGSALYIAVEEEGGGEHSFSGKVEDLNVAGYMMAADIGDSMTEDQIYQTASRIAEELRTWGINMNLGPVADIASSQNTGYKRRCFSTDASRVSKAVSSYVEGMRDHALATSLKYFPGIGNVPGDYTNEILKNNDSLMTLRSKNFKMYSAGIKAGTDCIMMSNVAVPKITVDEKLPAFMSSDIVTSILRQELDFEGVILTSDLNLPVLTQNYKQEELAIKAVEAGCDMLVVQADFRAAYEGLLAAVQSGQIDEKVINTSVRRILQNKIQRGIYVLENNN